MNGTFGGFGGGFGDLGAPVGDGNLGDYGNLGDGSVDSTGYGDYGAGAYDWPKCAPGDPKRGCQGPDVVVLQ